MNYAVQEWQSTLVERLAKMLGWLENARREARDATWEGRWAWPENDDASADGAGHEEKSNA